MAHQYMPKIFHDPPQKLSAPPPFYILNVRSLNGVTDPLIFSIIWGIEKLFEMRGKQELGDLKLGN